MRGKLGLGGIEWWHRIYIPGHGYTEGAVNHGPDGGDWPTYRFGMPKDLTGKTVLDVGAWDGFFSFEAEKRGAYEVRATDCDASTGGNPCGSAGFKYAATALNSRVIWRELNIETDYAFSHDIVLCYGVLYHLKSPLRAIENLALSTDEYCLLETAISTLNGSPVLEYRPGFDNDPTNYFYPNIAWICAAAKQSGFSAVEVVYNDGTRATLKLIK